MAPDQVVSWERSAAKSRNLAADVAHLTSVVTRIRKNSCAMGFCHPEPKAKDLARKWAVSSLRGPDPSLRCAPFRMTCCIRIYTHLHHAYPARKSRHCSIVTDDFLTFGPGIGRYLREKDLLEIWSWMALEAMWPIPRKASGVSRIFPRRRSSDGPAIIHDALAPDADTGRIGFGRPIGCSTIWATRCPGGRASWR